MTWVTFSCFLLCLLSSSCVTRYSNVSSSQAVNRQIVTNGPIIESVTKVKTTLTNTAASRWAVDEKRVPRRESLRSVFFLDRDHGWVGGKRALYRTTDGGDTWLSVDVDLPTEAFVTEILFQNESVGWLVVQKEAASPLTYQDNYFRLVRTTDGGETWNTQLEDKDSVINRIQFLNNGEGWLIGYKYTNAEPLRTDDFIMHTSDLGENWKDVSGSLNELLRGAPIKVEFTDILTDGPSRASVLLPRGSVFKTNDAGQNWYRQNGTIDDSSYACSCHIGVTDKHSIWVGGDKDDSHSLLGMIAVRDADTWKEYILSGVSFSDIQFLSGDQILTCGSTTPSQERYTVKREAVISYSLDRGTSWSFVYHNARARKINALFSVDTNHIWAAGDDGIVVRLTATAKAD